MKSFRIHAETGNPVEVFFPGAGKAIAVYENGYVPIFLDEGRVGDWLATDMFWDMMWRKPAAMLRVRFWKAGVCEERLLVETYGSVGDVREEFIASRSAVQIGPVRVASASYDYDMNRALLIFHWDRQELMLVGRAVAFCQNDLSLDLAIVGDIHFANKRLWMRATSGEVERYKLPVEGEVELGHGMAAILKPSGEVYLAKISANAARFVAGDAWIVGLSPDGAEMAMCRRESGSWVWDFRQVSNLEKPTRVLQATAPVELGLATTPCIARVSPDFRWAVAISQGHVVAWPVQEGV
jgi:hypothetical protein